MAKGILQKVCKMSKCVFQSNVQQHHCKLKREERLNKRRRKEEMMEKANAGA